MGTKAYLLLGDPDRRWTVLASVSGAIYMENDANDLLWLAGGRLALHGRAILLDSMPSRLPSAGTSCWFHGSSLHIGHQLVVDLEGAAVWRPALAPRDEVRLVERCDHLVRALHRFALQTVSRGYFIHVVAPAVAHTGSGSGIGTTLVFAARRGVAALERLTSGSDLVKGLKAAQGLVGLGEGLTPSGDDFLGGFLFTLSVLDRASGSSCGIDWEGVMAWIERVEPLTNKISYPMLVDHARGEAAEPLSTLLQATLTESSLARLARLASRVGGIGNSSGWDMLAGVYCATSVAKRMLDGASDAGSGSLGDANRDSTHLQAQRRKEAVRVC